ncbi:hypothetical protein [Nostoc sp. WHI]|uniref:hypothetical protein n=1 Tax=Nostoc sp. WHI TaxID=2650611 RepID=UPI0018C4727E|nr:hypothetical protein [Nostoc sp. WHI]MBG1267750.1 hypothetical protein [Nostoc sp. WHI]
MQKEFIAYDKRFDLHLLDYVHYKDANLLVYKGLGDNITHVWMKTEKLVAKQESEVKELQQFLKKQQDFKIRE